MTGQAWDRVPIDAQSIEAPLSQAAIFLVVGVSEGEDALGKVRDMLGGLDDLVKTVGFRDLSARLSCITGIGSDLWDPLGPTGEADRAEALRRDRGKTTRSACDTG